MNLTKIELVNLLAEFFNKPKSYFKNEPKEALEFLWEEEVLPQLMEASQPQTN